ncbi:hypothetical protein PC9H_000445 [Pleurotus ostreatus]|uniref:Amidase domain-containing protein n=1 Tax=Pleurotus ostreatus TaxID=5322 RepID=A0A8H7A536_PLEOS|nr:uncharacterized protein PC9H_000445 [Pleurotus ostreatus]KAF7440101.1 hypothetical protein PC9H_000445 [Pleurotus ostreatus]
MAVSARHRVEEKATNDAASKHCGCILSITVLVGLLSILVITGQRLYVPNTSSSLFATTTKSNGVALPDLYEASIAELQAGLHAGHFTSVDLVKAYFARIEEVNLKGPMLRAVLELNPSALEQAATLDRERKSEGARSPLHGIPILLKDNIATHPSEGMNTTAGSFSLLGSIVPEDAGVVKRLRKAGAIILGKGNMDEFAHFRGDNLPSGWSGRGGQNTNAYFPNGDPCGSSSGPGVATSIGLTTVSLGTETDGSIVCPSSNNNIVGIKPTVGLTSRAGVIPISAHQDTVGPMARSITDAAIVLSVIAGKDNNDNYTLAQPSFIPDYMEALNQNALRGKRIGVPRRAFCNDTDIEESVNVAFNHALDIIRGLGATVVDPADLPSADEIALSTNETTVTDVDFKIQINAWFDSLKTNPSGVRNLADLIKFNDDHPELEKPPQLEEQNMHALAFDEELGKTRGIDATLTVHQLDALVLPSVRFTITTIAGYPIVTVPLDFYPDNVAIGSAGPMTFYPAPGIPFGLSFFGTAFTEFDLIGFAFAFEQRTKARLKRKAFAAAIPKTQLKDVMSQR